MGGQAGLGPWASRDRGPHLSQECSSGHGRPLFPQVALQEGPFTRIWSPWASGVAHSILREAAHTGSEPGTLVPSTRAGRFITTEPPRKPLLLVIVLKYLKKTSLADWCNTFIFTVLREGKFHYDFIWVISVSELLACT